MVATHPNSLIACIYKARYFPVGSFWTAGDHLSPSFSWRSIFGTKALLQQGVCWKVGNGAAIQVWSDPWIPGAPSFKPHVIPTAAVLSTSVQEFILPNGRRDSQKVREAFSPIDDDLITSIPLSVRAPPDRLVWSPDSKGQFSVKPLTV